MAPFILFLLTILLATAFAYRNLERTAKIRQREKAARGEAEGERPMWRFHAGRGYRSDTNETTWDEDALVTDGLEPPSPKPARDGWSSADNGMRTWNDGAKTDPEAAAFPKAETEKDGVTPTQKVKHGDTQDETSAQAA